MSEKIVTSFEDATQEEGSKILALKNSVATATSPSDVPVNEMTTSLDACAGKFSTTQEELWMMQLRIHKAVELSKKHKKEHEADAVGKKATAEALRGQIPGLESEIKGSEADIGNMEQAANELDARAAEIDRAARKKKKRGIWGAIGGLVLAPFTGKYSESNACI